jgi:hypothetical protein
MTTTPNAFGIDDEFGSGGIGLAPDGASGASSSPQSPPFTAANNARDLFRAGLGALWAYGYANAAGLTASKAINRQTGQLVVKQDDFSLWIWEGANAASATATVIAPTDVGAGAGRWVQLVGPAAQAEAGFLKGTGTLVAGVASAIAAPGMTATSRIMVTRSGAGSSTAVGELTVTARTTGGTSTFTVTSLQPATPASTQTADVSTFDWLVAL